MPRYGRVVATHDLAATFAQPDERMHRILGRLDGDEVESDACERSMERFVAGDHGFGVPSAKRRI